MRMTRCQVLFCFITCAVLPLTFANLTAQTPVSPLPDGNAAVDAMNKKYIKVWRALMAPKNVADAFGRRIAKRYIAIQLTIANRNTEYQWLIQDASINLRHLLHHLDLSPTRCEENLERLLKMLQQNPRDVFVSSAELTVLRGVAEKANPSIRGI